MTSSGDAHTAVPTVGDDGDTAAGWPGTVRASETLFAGPFFPVSSSGVPESRRGDSKFIRTTPPRIVIRPRDTRIVIRLRCPRYFFAVLLGFLKKRRS